MNNEFPNISITTQDSSKIAELSVQGNSEEEKRQHTEPIIKYEDHIDEVDLSDHKPILEAPKAFAIGNILNHFIELQDRIATALISSSSKDIEQSRDTNKKSREELLVKIDKQIELKDKAAQESKVSRILSWVSTVIAVAFAVVATVFTAGGATPLLIGAAITLGMTILQESGAMDKITEAISKGISSICTKLGYSKEEADALGQQIATGIVATAVLAITIASCCTGNINPGSLMNAVCKFAPKIAMLVQKISTVGNRVNNLQRSVKISTRAELFTQGSLRSTEGGLNIDSGINQGEAERSQGEYIQMISLQKMIEKIITDNGDFIKNLMNAQQLIFTNFASIIKDIQETSLKLTRQNNV